MDLPKLIQFAINGLMASCFYALFAVGLALVFGVMKMINFAHGELYMLGGYTVWVLFTICSGVSRPVIFIFSVIVAALLVGALSILIERLLFRPLRANPFAGFLASLSLAYILQVLVARVFGVLQKNLPSIFPGVMAIGGAILPIQRLVVMILSVTMILSLWIFLMYTKTGRGIRASAQDSEVTALHGVGINRTSAIAMAIGGSLAAIAGVLMGSLIQIGPIMGDAIIWKAFNVVIVGGLGSIPGAIVASLLFGFLDTAIITYIDQQLVIMIDVLIMLLVLAFRPQGILGREKEG
jgi:branched-subunit amino acid ABC-type transport system permease component